MADTEFATILITAETAEQLEELVELAVEREWAACGNIIPGIRSIFRWEGTVHRASEALAVLHTRKALISKIIKLAEKHHPYSVPQVIALPVDAVLPEYGAWLLESTTDA